jgi:hypothetical protein
LQQLNALPWKNGTADYCLLASNTTSKPMLLVFPASVELLKTPSTTKKLLAQRAALSNGVVSHANFFLASSLAHKAMFLFLAGHLVVHVVLGFLNFFTVPKFTPRSWLSFSLVPTVHLFGVAFLLIHIRTRALVISVRVAIFTEGLSERSIGRRLKNI